MTLKHTVAHTVTLDGNEAAAYIAHLTNEVIAIYPITPSSPMGELSDEWSAKGTKNLWGSVPDIIEMQSEGGAAGAIHGALQAGALATSFTSSQGLLLMIPNMYKIAGELTPTVLHVAARSLAAQGLSIFGDHSDVMACRQTGYAMLCSNSVQEVMDFALISQAATLDAQVPFMHFFDGFRTSHEISKIEKLPLDVVRAMMDDSKIIVHRQRALSPDHPIIRGTSQNPDVYFQGRETVNPFYQHLPTSLEGVLESFGKLTGRHYRLFEYVGCDDAERVIVLMGSGCGAVEEAVEQLVANGEKVGMVKVRLYRPFSAERLLAAIPGSAQKIAVLDRCKEPGADGEPLYKDVITAFASAYANGSISTLPKITGGRYGLSSKEFTPGMVRGVFDELNKDKPKNGFTIGIYDDVSYTSLDWSEDFPLASHQGVTNCVFYGLGADGTVSANKNSIKIIGEETDNYAQGYFQYDSKKSGAITVSHLRFGPSPIRSSYLIGQNQAQFVACHQPQFVDRYELLELAAPGGIFLLNSAAPVDKVWDTLPRDMQQMMIDKQLQFYVIDAYAIARDAGMGQRINTIMQTCFFAISGILPQDEAILRIKEAVKKSYGRKGASVLEKNNRAIDAALAGLHRVDVPAAATNPSSRSSVIASDAPDFVRNVTACLIEGKGDSLPVSLIPADGSWPTGTTAYEKRSLALELPKLEDDLCTHCGKCVMVCPHAAIRSKVFPESAVALAPESFKHMAVKGGGFDKGIRISYQIAPDDCTGCRLCVEVCPIRDKQNKERKALNMVADQAYHQQERGNWDFFLKLPEFDRTQLRENTIKGAMLMQPLFEFSGACSGCGETPYIKLATQLFGDRMLIANATGCSSIFGGNLPTTPYTRNAEGRGPAWSNSLFEDNAEFGLGMRVAIDKQMTYAQELVARLRHDIGDGLAEGILNADQDTEAGIFEQRQRVAQLKQRLQHLDSADALALDGIADELVRKSVWMIGGDGWAYDIGYGGLDHVFASHRNVNILVLDTEVYSNTGGQTSKATPLGAVAKFSAAGRPAAKKDLAMMAMAYGHVYVARVAFGAKDVQTLRTFLEAESYDGPSVIIAYSPCISHGFDLSQNLQQQELAVNSGHWPLFRYDPRRAAQGENPLQMDSKTPSVAYSEFAGSETRFKMLERNHPELARRYVEQAQQHVDYRNALYEQLSQIAFRQQESEEAGAEAE